MIRDDDDDDDVVWKVLSANPAYQTLVSRILEKFIIPILLGVFLIVFWPIALYMKYKTLTEEKEYAAMEEERKFKVTHDDLIEQVSVQQVEALEMIVDPLSAVPDLPFGHLNTAWLQFINNMAEGELLWSFNSHFTPGWGCGEVRTGYVVVRDDAIRVWFVSTMRTIDEK